MSIHPSWGRARKKGYLLLFRGRRSINLDGPSIYTSAVLTHLSLLLLRKNNNHSALDFHRLMMLNHTGCQPITFKNPQATLAIEQQEEGETSK